MTGDQADSPNPGAEALVRLSAALATRREEHLTEALVSCVEEADAEAVEEVLLQSYLFLGYPAALNAFARWRELSGRAPGPPAEEDWGRWARRGGEVCGRVYGGQYRGLRRNVRTLHPDMERWMVVEGYGKVLGRPGLSLVVRELCIAALLAVLGTPRQLYSHLRGALNAGARPREVEEALEVAWEFLPRRGRVQAREVWNEVLARRGSTG